jgi:hypothetical protein
MRFGKVSGYVVARDDALWLTVTLESGRGIKTIRDERAALLRPDLSRESLDWQADQYTQETIGVDMAGDGWEAIAEEAPAADGLEGIGRSSIYTVRNLSWERE